MKGSSPAVVGFRLAERNVR